MKSLKSAARRGSIVSLAAISALALSACSAGQVTQTADQVAAVDGNFADNADPQVSLRGVTVRLGDVTGEAFLSFTASNQDVSGEPVTLESVNVDGQELPLDNVDPIGHNCSVVADSEENLQDMPQSENIDCIQYVPAPLQNDDFPYGGTVPVTFTFDFGTMELDAPVSAPELPAGEVERDYSTPGPL